MKPARRIAQLEPYFFPEVGKRIAELRLQGRDIIRMDIGSPDNPPPDRIIEALAARAREKNTHGYTAFGGTPEYRKAIAHYYRQRFRVELDPHLECLGLIGSKEGIFSLSQVLLDPGDLVLVPDPGYATYTHSAEIAGAEVVSLPLLAERNYLPDLEGIPPDIRRRAKLLWLNYPNNPTGAVAPRAFFQEVIDFGRQHSIMIAHDAPYTDISYDGFQPMSLLEIPGARETAVEFNSLSKTYNMAGWRLGMAVGNKEVLGYLEQYKEQKDTAHFEPVLYAGIAALTGDQSWIKDRNWIYQERRDRLLKAMNQMEIACLIPKAALYIWASVPDGGDDYDYCRRMLEEAGVSTTPGSVFGAHGKGFFRLSLCTPLEQIEAAVERMQDWMRVKI